MGFECGTESSSGREIGSLRGKKRMGEYRKQKKCTAIVLAAGKGSRMGTAVAKQYLEIGGKPVVVHALEAFEKAPEISDILLMTGKGQEEYCRCEIVEKYGIQKVSAISEGGSERYETVWKALLLLETMEKNQEEKSEYIFIHDGARPFVNQEIIRRAYEKVEECGACVVGMPVKDTIKILDQQGNIAESPQRELVWQAQTPQVFQRTLIVEAFKKLMSHPVSRITDDAMVVEQEMGTRVQMVKGSYENIKITTPEDLEIAEAFLNVRKI